MKGPAQHTVEPSLYLKKGGGGQRQSHMQDIADRWARKPALSSCQLSPIHLSQVATLALLPLFLSHPIQLEHFSSATSLSFSTHPNCSNHFLLPHHSMGPIPQPQNTLSIP